MIYIVLISGSTSHEMEQLEVKRGVPTKLPTFSHCMGWLSSGVKGNTLVNVP